MIDPQTLAKQILCIAVPEIGIAKGNCDERVKTYWKVSGWSPSNCPAWCVPFAEFVLKTALDILESTNKNYSRWDASRTYGKAYDTVGFLQSIGIQINYAKDGYIPQPGMLYWRNRLPETQNDPFNPNEWGEGKSRPSHIGIIWKVDNNKITTIDGNAGNDNTQDTVAWYEYSYNSAKNLRFAYIDVLSFFEINPSKFKDCLPNNDTPRDPFGPPEPPPGDPFVPPTPPGNSNVPPQNCVSTSWLPNVDYCKGVKFKQVDNCGNVREMEGTKECNTQVFCPPGLTYNRNTGECVEPCNDTTWNPPITPTLCKNTSLLQTSNCGNTRVVQGTKDCSSTNEFGKCNCAMPIVNIRVTPACDSTTGNIVTRTVETSNQQNTGSEFGIIYGNNNGLSDGNVLLVDIQTLANKYGFPRARTVSEHIANIQNYDLSKLPNKTEFLKDVQDLANKYKNSTELADKVIGMSLQLIVDRYASVGSEGAKNFISYCQQTIQLKVTNRTKHFSMLNAMNEKGKTAIAGAIMRVADVEWGMRPDERPNSEPIQVSSKEQALALGRDENGYALSKDENLAQNNALLWIAGSEEAPKGNGRYLRPETASASRALGTGVFTDTNGNIFFCVSDFDDRHKLYMKNRVYGERVLFITCEDFKQGNWERRRQEASKLYTHPQKAGGRYKKRLGQGDPWENTRLRLNDFFIDYHYGYDYDKVFTPDEKAFIKSFQDFDGSGNFHLLMEYIESKQKKWDFSFVFLMEVNNAGLSWNMVLKIVANYVLPLVSTAVNAIFPGMGVALQQAISVGMKVVADALNKIADGVAITLDFAVQGIFDIVRATLPPSMQQYADNGLNAYKAVRSGDYGALASSLGAMVPVEYRQQFQKALNEGAIGDVMNYVRTNVDSIKHTVTSFANVTLPNSMSSMFSNIGIEKFNNDIISGVSTIFTAKDPAGRPGITNLFTSLAQGGVPNILAPQLSKLQSVVQQQLKINVAQVDAFTRLSAGLDDIPSDVFEGFAVEGIKQVAKTYGQKYVVIPDGFSPERQDCIGAELAEALAEDGIQVILRSADIPAERGSSQSAGGTDFGTNGGGNNGANGGFPSSQGQTANCPPPVINLDVKTWSWGKPCLDEFDYKAYAPTNEFDRTAVSYNASDPRLQPGYVAPIVQQKDERLNRVEMWLKSVGGYSQQAINEYLANRKPYKIFDTPLDTPSNDPDFNEILGAGNVGLILYGSGSNYDTARASFIPGAKRILGEYDYGTAIGTKTVGELNQIPNLINALALNVNNRYQLGGFGLSDNFECDSHCKDIRKIYSAILSLQKAPNGAIQQNYLPILNQILSELAILKNKQTTVDLSEIKTLLSQLLQQNRMGFENISRQVSQLKLTCPNTVDYSARFSRIEQLLELCKAPTQIDNSTKIEELKQLILSIKNAPTTPNNPGYDKILELLSKQQSEKVSSELIQMLSTTKNSNEAILERLKLLEKRLEQTPPNNSQEANRIIKEIVENRNTIIERINNGNVDPITSYELTDLDYLQRKANQFNSSSNSSNGLKRRYIEEIYEYPPCCNEDKTNECCEFE